MQATLFFSFLSTLESIDSGSMTSPPGSIPLHVDKIDFKGSWLSGEREREWGLCDLPSKGRNLFIFFVCFSSLSLRQTIRHLVSRKEFSTHMQVMTMIFQYLFPAARGISWYQLSHIVLTHTHKNPKSAETNKH